MRLLVGPGEEAVREVHLDDTELLDRIIEQGGESVVYPTIVFVGSRANKIEIPQKNPRSRDVCLQINLVLEEGRGGRMFSWTIGVHDGELQIRGG